MKARELLHRIVKPFKFSSRRDGSSKEDDIEAIAAQEQKHFAYETLTRATDKFHPNCKLGEGGFGPVYKGKLADGRDVAVKMLSKGSRQGKKEFQNEAKLLARVQHRNVVNLLGYCAHADEKLIVYEYVPRESLDKFLFKSNRREELDWKKRFDIIIGVAKGLLYLHEHAHCCIIHRDIKASNILLDEKWTPKIADFGMARLYPEDQTYVNTRVAGTNGYMAPEYVMHGRLSIKADVFSLGVLMLELVSGQRNSMYNPNFGGENLLEWAYELFKKGRSLEILDTALASTAIAEQVTLCIHIGLLCTQSDPQSRPPMNRVVVMLSKRPTSLEQPSRPGLPDRRSRHRHTGEASSNAGTSGASSTFRSGTTSISTRTTATVTASPRHTTSRSRLPLSLATSTSRSPRKSEDPHGKRPVEALGIV